MSDKDKDKASDSGIDLTRRSRSGSGSFAGVDQSSFTDFDDSGHGSRRGTYDDYDDDDYVDPVKVDLDAFMGNVPAGDDVGDEDGEDEEEEGSEEEYEEDEEDEGEYETEEEGDAADVVGPSDEIFTHVETPSHQILQDQNEANKMTLKEKKRALIKEYLHDVKHFNHLRTKNILLGIKIMRDLDRSQSVIEKYMQQELEEQEKLKEAERLKRLHFLETCAAFGKGKKKKGYKKSKKEKLPKKKKMARARFSLAAPTDQQTTSPEISSSDPELKKKFNISKESKDVPDVSLNALGKEYIYKTDTLKEQKAILEDISKKKPACKPQAYLRYRIGKRLKKFSFMRSQFYKDVLKPKTKKKRIDLMNLTIEKLRSKHSKYLYGKVTKFSDSASAVDTSVPTAVPSTSRPRPTSRLNNSVNSLLHGTRSGRKKKFVVSKQALNLAKSKSRMNLDHRKQEQKIKMHADSNDYKDLHNFKFEFADPRLTAKQASVKLRDELLKLLRLRHIPTTQLKWPLEVKGVEFEGKNPYGRVTLNYSRLSHHEKELPHTSYRVLLTNLAFLRTKEQRMNKEHRKNMNLLENERMELNAGLHQIFREIVEGIRIFSSLCGISDMERKEVKHVGEMFIQELESFFDDFLQKMLQKLYGCIHSCEFALRRLWISEGKGEGAELHEFKDIMRCREKLKAEHRGIEKVITSYQRHSNNVLKTVRNSGKRLRDAKHSVGKITSEVTHLKKAVGVMIDGMYHCQGIVNKQLTTEVQLKSDAGILNSPVVTADYGRVLAKIDETKTKRLDLQRQYNSKVRAIEKIMQPQTRFIRYKLRS